MPTQGPTTDQGTLARGATIGRFVVLGLVGRGGMGEVYAAYDPELDRKVAVKLLRVKPGAGVSQAEGRARTLREAQAIARLSHPNVVVVYDVGTFQDKVFIAMEFVEGNTVTYWVESQARSWQDVLKVFMAAGRGLAAAHEKGLVHRDFKPDNVMVGKDAQVRVMDFGLARAAPERVGRVRGAGSDSSERTLGDSGSARRDVSGERGPRTARLDQGPDTPRLRTPGDPGSFEDVAFDTPRRSDRASGPAPDSDSGRRSDSSVRLRESEARVPNDPAARVRGDSSQRRGTPRYLHAVDSVPGQTKVPPTGDSREDAVPRTVDPNSTMVLNMPPSSGSDEGGNLAAFDVPLTRTGAMMGTPAYMAPEQFLGTPTDARTDQFAFCISLYEALYGERPFAGNTMYTLTTNVVQGNVRSAPANSKVPPWVRKILLRGLRPHADDRWPSIEDLLDALGKNPAVARRKWVAAVAGPVLVLGIAFGIRQSLANREPPCGGAPAKLAGIWELRRPGEGESPRQEQIHRAFLATGKAYAADVYATVSHALSTYAQEWSNMRREACEATDIRHEQSAEVLDLRMECLDERLGGLRALTDVFADASGDVVENAASAANSLGSLDRCADVPLLRAVVKPPENAATKRQVAELRDRLSAVKARFDSGHVTTAMKEGSALVAEARRTKYEPLIAEALALVGYMAVRGNKSPGASAALVEAFLAADSSRHDEVRAEVAADLVYVVGAQEGDYVAANRWARIADSVLKRLGGHDLLHAWLLNDLGVVLQLQGQSEKALATQVEALSLKERALGRNHPDVGLSEANIGIVLAEMGRTGEALVHIDHAISILQTGLGSGHPDVAMALMNRGEVLNSLGRFAEGRQSHERARATWEREFGPDHGMLAYALTGIGVSYLGEGAPANALVPLERAVRIRDAQETDSSRIAESKFALARALWDSRRDRGRARSLAEAARGEYERAEEASAQPKKEEVERWLETHRSS